MLRTRPIQMNFTNGEISPRLFGRSDLAKYWNSVEILENFIILPYGGVTRRDGLHYVAAQGDETRKVRMIPFIFSTEQAYAIEAGHEYMRFFMNHGQILAGPDAYTVLLLHMNGSHGSQTFLDSSASAHIITANGTAQIDTTQRKFGSGCGLFDSAGTAYLTVADHPDFDFSADDVFTIEFNIKQSFLGTYIAAEQSVDANNLWRIIVWADGHVTFGVEHTSLWQLLETAAGVLTADAWHHIRVVGNGTNYYLFVDGSLLVTAAITKSMQNFTGLLQIGRSSISPYDYVKGWLDEFRISNFARSTADFAPPTQEFPLVGEDIPYEIATPYQESDLPDLQIEAQSFDTMYIFHPDHAWRKLTRTGHAAWTLTEVDFTNGPWLEELADIAFTPSGTTGSITITSDAAFFLDGHVGGLLRLENAGTWGYVKIASVLTAQSATATVKEALGSTAASTAYQEGAWSGERGWPSGGVYNEASLITVANDDQPRNIWASKKGDFENFEAGTDDNDAYVYDIPASNRILWPAVLRELILGTGDGIYKMTGGMDDYISPTNVRVKPELAIGVTGIAPIRVANSLLFWQNGRRKLLELTSDPQTYDENYVSPDISLLADHITVGGIRYSAWQQEPNSMLWSVRVDGVMPTMTYMRPEDIVGWARQITDGEIESVAIIPDPTDSFNEAWVSVKRTGVTSADSDTVLFLHFGGPDGSTTFSDSSASAHTVTAHGSAQIDTSQSKFGGTSGKFTSAGVSYLTIPDHADFDFSADDIFTIEFFMRPVYLESVILALQSTGTNNSWQISMTGAGALVFAVENAGVAQSLSSGDGVLTVDTWHHIRIVGDGTSYYLFVDGALLQDDLITQSMANLTSVISIGAYLPGPFNHFTGWLDEFKISDLARSTADFMVPTTNISEHRYIEFMDPDMMVDSGITYSGAVVSSVSGADHLEGETVDIVGDDVQYDQAVVIGGVVPISPAASEIQIGRPYTSKVITMKPIINSEQGTTAGLPKKWAEVWVSLYETSGLTINNEVINFQGDIAPGEAIPLFTGNKKVSQLGWNEGRITIEHSAPLPCTILSIFGTLEVGN